VRVNVGGDPGRDDYGLPPVDIEIPDDARELDRDVHAYYRELRALRRRTLARRLTAPLSRDGMVLPLLAGCLALTLLAGTLLTVLTTGQRPVTTTQLQSPGKAQPRGRASLAGGLLPDRLVLQDGKLQSLRNLAGGVLVLALIPARCRCQPDVQRLTTLAKRAHAFIYLVGTQQEPLVTLSRQVGLKSTAAVTDVENALPGPFHPGSLTAVLVRTNGTVAQFVPDPAHNPAFGARLKRLTPGGTWLAPAGTKVLPQPRGPGSPRAAATVTL
jgi:hypothetical protein